LAGSSATPLVSLWLDQQRNGKQLDRAGNALVSTSTIPPKWMRAVLADRKPPWNGMQTVLANAILSFSTTYQRPRRRLQLAIISLFGSATAQPEGPDQTAQAKLFPKCRRQFDSHFSPRFPDAGY